MELSGACSRAVLTERKSPVFLDATANNLQRRVAIIGSILIVAPMALVVLSGWAILERIEHLPIATEPSKRSHPHVDPSQIAQNLVEACRKYSLASVQALKSGRQILEQTGKIRVDGTHSSIWHARNEVTGQMKAFQVPLMAAGQVAFVPVTDFAQPAPAVDEITKITGTPATIFQRLNDQGDMLRVASTLKSEQGTRAIGTFIPAQSRQGESARILEDVLNGKTYIGKEVQNKVAYLTAYQPLINSWGKVVGVLNTVFPEEQIRSQVRRAVGISDANSQTPQLFIFEASGDNRGAALVMTDKSLEGRNLWDEKDSAGRPYVQEMCARATQLSSGELAEYKFQKANRSGNIPATLTAQFAYVPELDWVVGVTHPETNSQANLPAVQALVWAMWLLFGVSVASTGLAIRLWLEFCHDLAPKLTSLLNHLRKDAKQLTEAAVELSQEAEQAAAERTTKIVMPAPATPAVPAITTTARGDVDRTIKHINASSAWVGEMLDALDQITFATNHLMVSAALESGTSPNGGQSIADSADEMRSLVQRCRQAARTAKAEILQSRAELQKDLALPAPVPQTGDEHSLTMRRQADNLLRLAEGIDRTAAVVSAEVSVTPDEN